MTSTQTETQLRTILTAGDRLDDITRARMWSQIEDQVAAPAPAAAPVSWKRTAALAVGAIAVAAAVLLVIRAGRTPAVREGQLAVAAESTLTTRLGPHARAALVGPAQLELLGPAGDATSVRLDRGTLLAEFTGGAGRSLRIEAGDLVVEIVGTLFAVEVTDQRACVAVAHGTVRVTRGATSTLVTDRQQLCSDDAAPRPIPADLTEQLARHEQSLLLATAPRVDDPPAAVAPPAPASTRRTSPDPAATATTATTPATAPRTSSPPAATSRTTTTASAAPTATPTATRSSSTASAPRSAPAASTIGPSTTAPSTAATSTTAPSTETTSTSTAPSTPATATTSPPPPSALATTASPPAAEPASPAPKAPTAAELYRAAETALAKGDRAGADRALAQVIALGDALADQALYDRARIAYQGRAWAAARRHLAALAAIASTPLAEPGRYLDCRIAVESKAADAERCFTAYRAAYPRSPHDLDVLAVLAQLAHARGGCTAARVLTGEIIARYPRTDHAAAWRSRCPEAP